MLVLVIIAVISLILGVFFLLNDKILEKITEAMNKVVIKNKLMSVKTKKIVGLLLIIFACALFMIASTLR